MNDIAFSQAFLPPLLRALLAALLFAWLVVALGRRALRLLGVSFPYTTVWERAFISGAIGAGLLQFLPYGLAAFSMLRPGPLRFSLLLLVLLLAMDLSVVARTLWRTLRALDLRLTPDTLAWAACFAALLLILLVRASTIGDLSDDDGYHLASPKRWLALGTLSYLPTYTNTNASMGFEMLYAIGMAAWDAVAAKGFNYASGLFVLLGVWLCGRRIAGNLAGVFAISLLLISNRLVDLPYVFSLAFVDLGACWMATACAFSWLLWRESSNSKLLVCMALCAGFTGSFKTTALSAGIAWAVPVVIELRRRGVSWNRSVSLLAGFGALSLLPVLPWFFRNYEVTGNPLYPMLSGVVRTRDWSQEYGVIFAKYTRYFAWANGMGSRLDVIQRKEILCAAAVVVALAGAAAIARARRAELRGFLIFSTLSTLISMLFTGLLFRYWLPSAICISVVLGILASEQAQLLRWRLWAPTALLAVALVVQLREHPGEHKSLLSDVRLAAGLSSLDQERAASQGWNTWNYINAHTPVDAHVLLAAFYTTFGASSAGGFWIDRTCYATDSHLQRYIRFDDWDEFLRSIRAATIGYVVISDRQSVPDRLGFSFLAAKNEYPFCRRLVDTYGERLYYVPPMALYRLKLPLQ